VATPAPTPTRCAAPHWNSSEAAPTPRWPRSRGRLAWAAWLVLHLYFLIGFRNRLTVLLNWLWAYLTFQRGARLIDEPLEAELQEEPADELTQDDGKR
jgi:NADH:ubiquinone reductase (H+-translocating)